MDEVASRVGDGVLNSNIVTISRRYGETPHVRTELDFQKALEFLYSKFVLSAPERSVLSSAHTTSALIEILPRLANPTSKHSNLQAYLSQQGSVTSQVATAVKEMLPKFMYFSSYDRMEGAIQLEQTQHLIDIGQIQFDKHRGTCLFAEFLDYAGVSIEEISGVDTYETFNAKLQAASNNITDQILEYWTQNPDLNVVVRIEQARPGDQAPLNEGTIARARIENQLHRVDTPFSERSAGFVWFFSFLVKFAQVKDEDSPVILLLDEPGLSLHGKAQGDLQRFIKEKLAPHHQVIYSTHSPFMVPADDFQSVRIVEDQVKQQGHRRVSNGTKVREDVFALDPETLFPLQGALGYEISQTLFVGQDTLLVEGPSDILYIQALSNELRNRGRTGLDSRWTLCPSGGIDKIMPFVSLFSGNDLHVAVLSDEASGDKGKVRRIKESSVLRAGHFFTLADFLEIAEADVEDIFDPELFVAIVNGCYQLEEQHELTVEALEAQSNSTTRIVKKVEAAFRLMPESIPMFNHFAPAAWLIRNPQVLSEAKSEQIEKTLDQAEKTFETYNKLL